MANEFGDTMVDGVLTVADQGSGTFTIANSENVASSNNATLRHFRIGNLVLVSLSVEITPTAANTNTHFRFAPPIASAFTNSRHCIGSGTAENSTPSPRVYLPAYVLSSGAEDRIEVRFTPTSTNTFIVRCVAMYLIL